MKVFADLSVLLKIAFACVVIGVTLGLCMTRTSWQLPDTTSVPVAPAPSAQPSAQPQ